MSTFDLVRRAAAVVLTVACLLTVSSLAQAGFTGSGSGALSVGSGRLDQPTAVKGTYRCSATGKEESVEFSVTGFDDGSVTGPDRTVSYRYSLQAAGQAILTESDPGRSHTIRSDDQSNDKSPTTWTLRIWAVLPGTTWTGTPYAFDVECKKNGTQTGQIS